MKFKNILKVMNEKQEIAVRLFTNGFFKDAIYTNKLEMCMEHEDLLELKVTGVFTINSDDRIYIYLDNKTW